MYIKFSKIQNTEYKLLGMQWKSYQHTMTKYPIALDFQNVDWRIFFQSLIIKRAPNEKQTDHTDY